MSFGPQWYMLLRSADFATFPYHPGYLPRDKTRPHSYPSHRKLLVSGTVSWHPADAGSLGEGAVPATTRAAPPPPPGPAQWPGSGPGPDFRWSGCRAPATGASGAQFRPCRVSGGRPSAATLLAQLLGFNQLLQPVPAWSFKWQEASKTDKQSWASCKLGPLRLSPGLALNDGTGQGGQAGDR